MVKLSACYLNTKLLRGLNTVQTRLESLIETMVGTLVAFVISVLAQRLLFPLYNINIPISNSVEIVFIFTIATIIRSYVVRRFFNYLHHVRKQKLRAQTRFESGVETVLGTLIAYSIGLLVQLYVFPKYNINVSIQTNMELVFIFTIISIIRSYIVRRCFNYFTVLKLRLANEYR
jgi:hypothetical protein